MIDHWLRITNTVKDEFTRLCTANGIGKDESGWMAYGTFAPVVGPQGQIVNMAPAVFITLSVRSQLAPFKPIGNGAPAYGVLPDDAALRAVVGQIVEQLVKQRREELTAA